MADSGFTVERIEREGGAVALAVVHGVKSLNLVGRECMDDCAAGMRELATDATIRCVVLRGKEDASFIGGANLNELRALEPHNAAEFVFAIHEFCAAIRAMPVPVIARLRGHCLGAGLEIAAACDFRISDEGASFGMPEVRVGVPSVVDAVLLPQLIGFGKTRELVFRGNIIDAREALSIGLVEQCVEVGELDDAIEESLSDILSAAPTAIRLQKELCAQWENLDYEAAVAASLKSFARAYESGEPAVYCQKFFDGKA